MFAILIFILLTIACFFSAFETAITVASKAKIYKMAKKGNKKAEIAKKLLASPGNVITTLLTVTTFILVFVGSLEGRWSDSFGPSVKMIAPFIMATIVLIYSETLPKMFALDYSLHILLYLSNIMYYIVLIFSPFNKIINIISKKILRTLRIKKKDKEHDIDELRSYIDMYYMLSLNRDIEERAMLKSILYLDELTVEDIIVHRKNVTMIDSKMPFSKIHNFIIDCPYTRIPIYKDDQDNIIGILNIRSFFKYLAEKKKKEFNILEHITKPWFVPNNTDLLDQLRAFRRRQEHMAIVVDEYGSCLGVVTLEDILEEIVGDITDEYDIKVGKITKSSDGNYIVSGDYGIRDLNKEFELDIPYDEASTVSGLILNTVKKIPEIGEVFSIYGVKFEILKKQKHFIVLAKIIIDK